MLQRPSFRSKKMLQLIEYKLSRLKRRQKCKLRSRQHHRSWRQTDKLLSSS